MALGGKESGEPLSSEDMTLLEAVAAQVATAIENGRLYQQLQRKADELNRKRELQRERRRVAAGRPAGGRPRRARGALEPGDGADLRRAARRGRRPSARRAVRRASSSRAARAWRARGGPAENGRRSTACRSCRGTPTAARKRLVNVAEAPLRDVDGRTRRHDRHPRGHHLARAARGAAADLREDGVDRPARGRRRARGQHAADRHLELHADAARAGRSGRSADEAAREDRAADLPRRQDRQQPAEPVAAARRPTRPGRPARRHQRRAVAARAPVPHGERPGAQGPAGRGADRPRRSSTSCSRCS